MDILAIIWESGLVVKGVLILLLVLSILSWGIVFHYHKFYKKIQDLNTEFLAIFFKDSISSFSSLNSLNDKTEKYKDSPLFHVWNNFYKELRRVNDKVAEVENLDLATYLDKNNYDNFERSLLKGSNEAIKEVDRHRSMLASIATVTPFVGLFGTVWGIINSFNGLAAGGGSIEAVAPGIAEALVATAVGLFAAIPASWFYNIYSKKLQNLKLDMNSFAQDLLNFLKYYSIR